MVIYDLICDAHHEFEGWFSNADDFKSQQSSQLLCCPICNSSNISKKLAAPKITRKSNTSDLKHAQKSNASNATAGLPNKAEAYKQVQSMLRKMHKHIDDNFSDVGNKFADKALSMHRGETEAENIKGTATATQLKELAEEGVSALPIPPKPVDKKKLN